MDAHAPDNEKHWMTVELEKIDDKSILGEVLRQAEQLTKSRTIQHNIIQGRCGTLMTWNIGLAAVFAALAAQAQVFDSIGLWALVPMGVWVAGGGVLAWAQASRAMSLPGVEGLFHIQNFKDGRATTDPIGFIRWQITNEAATAHRQWFQNEFITQRLNWGLALMAIAPISAVIIALGFAVGLFPPCQTALAGSAVQAVWGCS